ncbi:hypothetical protein ACOJTA_09500 [Malaciobacter sp. WC5094]
MKANSLVFENQLTQKIVDFIQSIGIEVRKETISEKTFLPGVLINKGAMIIDEERLLYEGDLLHEAGHIATLTPEKRVEVYNDVSKNPGDEMATLAWSYAAGRFLDIDPRIIFHDNGYKGESKWLAEHYSTGGDIGVPLLDWMELTISKNMAKEEDETFPIMKKWIRE